MADDIARLGYEIDSSQARTATADLDKLAGASDRVAASADGVRMSNNGISAQYKSQAMSAKQLKAAQDALAGATGRYGKSAQAASQHSTNLLFQFQDIGMMLAAGQNPLMLALQQGTQVAGVFHQMKESGQSAFSGIKKGLLGLINPTSLLTIGVIAGGAALVQWGVSALMAEDDTRTLEDAIDDLSESLMEYRRAAKDGGNMSQYIRDEFGKVSAETIELSERVQQLRLREVLLDAAEATKMLADNFQGNILRTEAEQIAKWFHDMGQGAELAQVNAGYLSQALEMVEAAGGPREQLEAVRLLGERFINIVGDINNMTDEQAEFYRKIVDTERQLQLVVNVTGDVSSGVNGITRAIEGAVNEAVRLRDALAQAGMASLDRQQQIRILESQIAAARRGASTAAAKASTETAIALSKTGATVDQIAAAAAKAGSEAAKIEKLGKILSDLTKPEKKEKSGGGGGAGDGKLQGLISSLMTERETLEVWRTEQLALLAQYNDAELAAIGGRNEAKLRLEKEYQERLAEVQKAENQARMAGYQTLFGDLASLMQSGNEKLFRIGQAAAIANATVDGWEAATAAWKWGMSAGGPGLAAIAAGASLARTAMMISNIASQSPNGSGSSGGGGGGAPTQGAAAPQQPERIVRVNLQGDKWMKDLAEGMLSQIYEATEDGARVVIAR